MTDILHVTVLPPHTWVAEALVEDERYIWWEWEMLAAEHSAEQLAGLVHPHRRTLAVE